MKITFILGTRPQIIKSIPLIKELEQREKIILTILHTGQHYNYEMSKIFLEELNLDAELINLEVGSGSPGSQIGRMLIKLEPVLVRLSPDLVIVPGDTNSTLAGALISSKLQIPICHLEAGLRSFDFKMSEEINRRFVDHCSTILLCPSKIAISNLTNEGISHDRIFFSGDTMVDALYLNLDIARVKSTILKKLSLIDKDFALITCHRAENVDNQANLTQIISSFLELGEIQLVFPVHPRTKKRLLEFNLIDKIKHASNLTLIEPVGYWDFITLMNNALCIFTDSGGIQKEALILKIPCITMRETTEWKETVELGSNVLTGSNKGKIISTFREKVLSGQFKDNLQTIENPYGDGKSSKRIADQILELYKHHQISLPFFNIQKDGYPEYKTLLVQKNSKFVSKKFKEVLKANPNLYVIRINELKGEEIAFKEDLELREGMIITYFSSKELK